ncbi:hypothetical protein Acor_56880 [Acrocarpospora corrugata]|uniref:Uncharacterized protein n=1 Tax=Acrocarpospora corrugata TaxID=35763 RepID=A0A5M3W6Q8_9ACTN|nr:hypothetical protein Acor_56880 [Acrocarpospora corrugata]
MLQCWTTTSAIPNTRSTSMNRSLGAGATAGVIGGDMVSDMGFTFGGDRPSKPPDSAPFGAAVHTPFLIVRRRVPLGV